MLNNFIIKIISKNNYKCITNNHFTWTVGYRISCVIIKFNILDTSDFDRI